MGLSSSDASVYLACNLSTPTERTQNNAKLNEDSPEYKNMPNKPHKTAAMHAGIKNLNKCTFHGFNLPADFEVSTTADCEVSTTAAGILHPCKSLHRDVCPGYHSLPLLQDPGSRLIKASSMSSSHFPEARSGVLTRTANLSNTESLYAYAPCRQRNTILHLYVRCGAGLTQCQGHLPT